MSLESTRSVVITSLDRSKYELILLGITKGGEWFRFYGDARLTGGRFLAERPLEMRPRRQLSPDRDLHGIVECPHERRAPPNSTPPSPVLHGRFGEDGTVQGLCNLAGIPLSAAVPLPPPSAWIRTELTSWPRSQAWIVPKSVSFPGFVHGRTGRVGLGLSLPLLFVPVRGRLFLRHHQGGNASEPPRRRT